MEVHLIDGTYELFRHYYALPSARDADGQEVARRARRGRVRARHDRAGRDACRRRHRPRHRVLPQSICGPDTRPARASSPTFSASSRCSKRRSPRSASRSGRWWSSRPTMRWRRRRPRRLATSRVERVIICTPDKDLAQCVRGTRVVQMDRRTRDHSRRSRRDREVRRAAGVDSRLPRAGRRRGGRLSRPARLGREIDRRGAGEIRPHLESIPADWRDVAGECDRRGARWPRR